MSPQPLITVITATFNVERYVEESIISVLTQTYPRIEYIIIDGGSIDGTKEIIKKYSDKMSYYVSEPDKGIYDAWNKALMQAKGEWICFIGADDYFINKDVIKEFVEKLDRFKKSGIKFVFGKVHQIDEQNNLLEEHGEPWEIGKKMFAKKMTLAHCGAFHHADLFKRYGNFNDQFKIAGDYEFLLRVYRDIPDFAIFIDKPVVVMRVGGISGNLKSRLRMARETELARKQNGLKSISWVIFWWILRVRVYIFIQWIVGVNIANYFADYYRSLIGKKRKWSVK